MKAHAPLIVTALVWSIFASALTAQEATEAGTFKSKESHKVHPSLPPFIFEWENKADADSVTIKISGGPKTFRGQTITADVEPYHAGFTLVDVNLDGYQDIRFLWNRGATGNQCYSYWIFDPKKGVFTQDLDFDQITYVDEKNKILTHYSKGGNIRTTEELYRVVNGKPQLVKAVETSWSQDARETIPDNIPDHVPVTITRLYKDGKLQRTFYRTQ